MLERCQMWRLRARSAPASEDLKHVLMFCPKREEGQREILEAAETNDCENGTNDQCRPESQCQMAY